MLTIAFHTLGCKVNQYDTQAMLEKFRAAGYEIVPFDAAADVYVINTCTVTGTGDKKSLQWLRRAKRATPQAITVLTGCYPQAFPQMAADAPADVVLGNADRSSIVDRVERFAVDRQRVVDILPHCTGEVFEDLPAAQPEGHTRAFLKIQDGCDRFCSYCLIPTARGRSRSKSLELIDKELKNLAENGYKEIVFVGINLSDYGKKTPYSLPDALVLAEKYDVDEEVLKRVLQHEEWETEKHHTTVNDGVVEQLALRSHKCSNRTNADDTENCKHHARDNGNVCEH